MHCNIFQLFQSEKKQSTPFHILILPALITKTENEQQTKNIDFQTRYEHYLYHKKVLGSVAEK